MRNIWVTTIVTVLLSCSLVWAAPRTGQRPEGICTSDFNLWGQSGQCTCGEGNVYDPRSGLCLEDAEVEEITVSGPVSAGMAAIGGETTGFEITTREGDIYELILKVADQEKLSTLDQLQVEVSGELILIEGGERQERRAIIAKAVGVLE
jgi:hypothetical protein